MQPRSASESHTSRTRSQEIPKPRSGRKKRSLAVLKKIKAQLDIQQLELTSESFEAGHHALNNWIKLCRLDYYRDACINYNAP